MSQYGHVISIEIDPQIEPVLSTNFEGNVSFLDIDNKVLWVAAWCGVASLDLPMEARNKQRYFQLGSIGVSRQLHK